VVCVDDKFTPEQREFLTALPVKDVVYVIRAVRVGVNWRGEPGEVCLYLIGLHNPLSDKPPHPERGFNSERFRPLEEAQGRVTTDTAEPEFTPVHAIPASKPWKPDLEIAK